MMPCPEHAGALCMYYTLLRSAPLRQICNAMQKSTEFGYSRKDVLLIGFGIFGGGFGLYYGLQAAGVPAGYAGNYVQLFVVLGLCVGWIGSYIFRVANKVTPLRAS